MTRKNEVAFRWIVTLLRKHKVPFCVSGGLAARIYGSKRPLADIDIEIADKGFEKILPEIQKYVTYGPKRYKDTTYNLLLITLHYVGQEIDLCGADSSSLFNHTTKKWIQEKIPLVEAPKKKVFGMIVPIIPREYLIYYKKVIGDTRDKEISSEI